MTNSKNTIRNTIIGLLLAVAIGLPVTAAVANAPNKSTVRFAEPTNKTIVLPVVEIEGTVPYVNPAPIAKKTAKKTVRHAVAKRVNQVVYTELEQGWKEDSSFVRRF